MKNPKNLMAYAPHKTNAESLSSLPYQWREGLPARGWKIFSEQPPPIGRRHLAVDLDHQRLLFDRHARHGQGAHVRASRAGSRRLSPAQLAEAVAVVNRLWSTDPVFRKAHRFRHHHLVTLVLVDREVFKAISSSEPEDELHQFNAQLWAWTAEPAPAAPA